MWSLVGDEEWLRFAGFDFVLEERLDLAYGGNRQFIILSKLAYAYAYAYAYA